MTQYQITVHSGEWTDLGNGIEIMAEQDIVLYARPRSRSLALSSATVRGVARQSVPPNSPKLDRRRAMFAEGLPKWLTVPGGPKPLHECTKSDFLYAINLRRQQAAQNSAAADRLQAALDEMVKQNVERFGDLR